MVNLPRAAPKVEERSSFFPSCIERTPQETNPIQLKPNCSNALLVKFLLLEVRGPFICRFLQIGVR